MLNNNQSNHLVGFAFRLSNTNRWMISLLLLSFLFLVQSCGPYYFREHFRDANDLLQYTGNVPTKLYLKAHLRDGQVYILTDTWAIDTVQHQVTGQGRLYDVNRRLVNSGPVSVPIDSVVIFETNKSLDKVENEPIAGLSILAGLDAILGVICITNPKTCFGSCPTFYINEEDNFHFANAEGFSQAISPSLEYADIDALDYSSEGVDSFSIIMKNEALETHSVNQVKLLAIPRAEDERIYHSPNDLFYRCDREVQFGQATAEEGDITGLLAETDRIERFSLADETNLSTKEEIHLTFDPSTDADALGLLISFRQTQMTTYLFYSAMDYMGGSVSDMFAKLERDNNPQELLENSIKGELGGIDVHIWNKDAQRWELQGTLNESGPIAFGHQILPLSAKVSGRELKVKLVLNKGLWRIDRVALTGIREVVEPDILEPSEALNKGTIDPDALKQIRNPEEYLVSMPGSTYRFSFVLPEKEKNYELFLQSQGYYLEWMRESWLREKNLLKLNQLLNHPRRYLKAETKAYKKQEKYMEEAFWNSRIDTKSFSYYEN